MTLNIAITGATGFVGATVLNDALDRGHAVRALTRRPQGLRDGCTWVEGSLERTDSLSALVESADVIIHIAGVVNAPDRAGFEAGNITGTRALLHAARAAGVKRIVHVSSLSAREPELSSYGWSKAGAEQAVRESGLEWTMVRPPAIYGPGDTEMLEMFRVARHGFLPMPPAGRLSVVHVADLSRLLLTLAEGHEGNALYDVDDGVPGGWSHKAFGQAIGAAVGKRPLVLSLPRSVLRLGAAFDRLTRGVKAKLTPDRVAYFCHPDWTIDPAQAPPAAIWQAQIDTPTGLRQTAQWYREKGWL